MLVRSHLKPSSKLSINLIHTGSTALPTRHKYYTPLMGPAHAMADHSYELHRFLIYLRYCPTADV